MPESWRIVDDAPEGAEWLTLVHGFIQDSRIFNRQVDAFRQTYRICLIDLPGHGGACDEPGPYGHHELTKHVLSVLDEAGIDETHFWGTHTGAAIGLLIGAREPERLLSLILEGPILPGTTLPVVADELAQARHLARTAGVDEAKRVWWEKACWFDVMRDNPVACRAAEHRQIIDGFAGGPWLDEQEPKPVLPADGALRQLAVPVLAYIGSRDHDDFKSVVETLKTILPNLWTEQVDEGGGFPLWEFPDRVNPMVASFLAAVGTRGDGLKPV